MCDYSLHNVKTRPARVGEKLITRDFGTGSRGFAAPEDKNVAVCLLKLWPWSGRVIKHQTAIFRQINQHERMNHHDALEFPDGEIVLLTFLETGQEATVLQLPASAGVRVEQETDRANEILPRLHIALGI